jgi:Ca2+-binding RTX toxin-like protein
VAIKSTFVGVKPLSSTIVYSGPTTTANSGPTYNFIDGTAGDDQLTGTDGLDSIWGYGGNDRIWAGGGDDYVWAEAGDDRVWAGAGNDHVFGGSGNDTLFGEAGNDRLYGEAGSDVLWGGDGMDTLHGGADRDYLFGESGTDYMYGGLGDDMLWGGDHDDQLFGEDGNDNLYGQDWDDTLDGGRGNDALEGGSGRDTLLGGADNDQLYGQDDDDKLDGGDGDDRLDGGWRSDILAGGAGNDVLYGGITKWFGDGTHDHLIGGSGADTFVLKASDVMKTFNPDGTVKFEHDRDLIGDFSRAEGDKIDIGSMLLYIAGFNGTAQQAIDEGYLILEEGPGRGGTQVNVFIDPNGSAPDALLHQRVYVAIVSGNTLATVGAEDFLVTSLGTNSQPVNEVGLAYMFAA